VDTTTVLSIIAALKRTKVESGSVVDENTLNFH